MPCDLRHAVSTYMLRAAVRSDMSLTPSEVAYFSDTLPPRRDVSGCRSTVTPAQRQLASQSRPGTFIHALHEESNAPRGQKRARQPSR